MVVQKVITIQTPGRGLIDITPQLVQAVHSQQAIETGLCNVFLHHTSASLTLCENYDPVVLKDLESFMQRLVPDGDPLFQHIEEGPDDMPSHIRTILTQNSISMPITQNQLVLGTWQGIFLWEHRLKPHNRKITITLQGNRD